MKNLITSRFIFSLTVTPLALLMPTPLIAQNATIELEQKPLPDLPDSISGNDLRSRINAFIKSQGLSEIKNNKKDETGRVVLIDIAYSTIGASASDPNFVSARINAFSKAMLNAKSQCAEFQKTLVKTEAVMDMSLPPSARVKADSEQLVREGLAQEGAIKAAEALNKDVSSSIKSPEIIKTAALYGEKLIRNKLQSEIRKKGLDPNKPIEQQTAKVIMESASFRNAVSTVAAARCTGIKVMASFEQNPKFGQGSVGIVTVWTDKLHRIADAMATNQWGLIKKGEPGRPIKEHYSLNKRTLLSTVGVQMVRNERGEYVLLAYAQERPRTKNQQSIDSAYEGAKARAIGMLRSFMGELVEVNRELIDAEVSTVFEDESTRYEENSSREKKVVATGKALPLSGVTWVHEWETLHPANNGPVVGVVAQWQVASGEIAAYISKRNSSRASNNGVINSGNASSGSNSRTGSSPKNEAYTGQGRTARDF